MDLGDFRPISLITSLYTIIAKVLSIRLKGVTEHVVSSTQSAFIQGHQLMDSIMITNECVDGRRREREPGVVSKLDIEKAYDRMDWDFLIWVLRRKGFGERWISWITGCVVEPFFLHFAKWNIKRIFQIYRRTATGRSFIPLSFYLGGGWVECYSQKGVGKRIGEWV